MAPPQAGHAGAAAAAADADSNADGMRDHHCARLRSLVQDCIAKHLYGSAVFYADKLLVLSGGAPADVYLLAQAMYVARQPLRALALLKAPPTVRGPTLQQQQQPHPTHEPPPSPLLSDARFAYLAAKCAAAAGEWHEALVLLGSEDGAEAELEALERAWAPALAAAAARAGAVAGGVQGADNEGAAAANPDAAAAAARTGTGGAAARGSSAGAAAAAGGGGRRSTGGGATSAAAAASAQARRRSSAGGAGGVQQQQQRHQASTSPTPADNHPPLLLPPGAAPASGTEVRLSSAVCLLRGRGYLALDDRARAARWLRAALLRDPFCEDAFALLVDGALLAAPQEVELVMALPLRPEDEWLRLMYRARCKQYGPGQERELDEVLDELQRPYAPDGRPALAAGQRGGGGNEEEQGAAAAMPMSPPTVPAGGRQSARRRRSSAGGAQQQQQQVTFASPPPQSAGAHPPQPLPLMTPATAEMAEAGPSPPPTIAVPTRSVGTKRTQTKQAKLGGPLRDMGGGSGTPPQATTTAGPLRGWGLGGCSAVLACRAARLLHLGRYAECLALTTALLARDAHAESALLPPHLAAALALGRKDELFLRAHRLVADQPDSAVAWHATGCYYLCARQPEAARRHFARATQLDRGFAPAWVALAHACSAQGEADQAVAAYRAAHRLFPGLHAPLLGMAAEYARMGSLALAERLLAQASRMCPGDPLPAHERGVLALRAGEWATAEAWLRRALDLAAERGGGGGGGKLGGPSSLSSSSSLPFLSTSAAVAWEPALVNLGHAVRKQGRYDEAAGLYEAALALSPRQAGTLAALGFARQLAGDSRGAADAYHQCLALRPDDAFALEMLSEALAEEYERFVADEGRQERDERAGGGGGGAAAPPRYDAFLRPAQQQQQRRRRQQEMGQHFHHDDDDMVIA